MSIVLAIFISTNLQVGGIRAKGPIGHTLRTFWKPLLTPGIKLALLQLCCPVHLCQQDRCETSLVHQPHRQNTTINHKDLARSLKTKTSKFFQKRSTQGELIGIPRSRETKQRKFSSQMLKKVAKSVDLVVKSLQQRTFFRRVASLTLKSSSPDGGCLLPHPAEFKRARSRSSCWYDCWHPRCCITPERELEAAMESINSTTIPTVHKEPTARKRVSLAAHPSLVHLLTLFFLPSQPNRVL
jgi:hypothetical protein